MIMDVGCRPLKMSFEILFYFSYQNMKKKYFEIGNEFVNWEDDFTIALIKIKEKKSSLGT
jgi:hypothetical protein